MAYQGRLSPLFPFDLQMKWDDLHRKIVAPFGSQRRETIWYGFALVCRTLEEANLPADVFIGGSFLTSVEEPEDIKFAVAVRFPLADFSEDQARTLADLARNRHHWSARQRCEFDLFLDEDEDGDLTEMIDHWLNSTCVNALGPPVRAVMVKLCQ
jgi:hypothetical protein